ncbi:MAG: carbon storage regulator [Thermosediminibacterales bacterium]|jgi:carbon storage regulator|nr:carbon storage regulator [Thermosediminibacterales bacterium]
MLVLTRKPGQSIIIGENIKITLIEIQGEQAKLGIDAPKSIAVHRMEVYEEIVKQNRISLETADTDISGVLKFLENREKKEGK